MPSYKQNQTGWEVNMSPKDDYMYKEIWKELVERTEDDEWKGTKKQGVEWEDFLRIVEAVSKGETPDWLILKGDKDSKQAAKVWAEAIEENKRREAAEKARRRREEVRKAALEKLSDEEKKALGLK